MPKIFYNIKLVILTVLLCCYSFSLAIAQSSTTNTNSIKGAITDSINQQPLAYVTVVVQESVTTKTIKSTLTNDSGFFEITGLPENQYKLILSYVGYKTKTIALPAFTSPTINLGTISLASTATLLDEIQVITQKPLVEQDAEKLIYNVDADPESAILNTLDMFRKIPLLTVDADDNLLLNGSNSYQILVNGKRSSLFSGNLQDILKGLPANSIKKVEVITNPPARYEAAGVGGIINIVTYRKSISGYNGSVNLGANSPEGYNGGSYVTANAGKVNFSGRINSSTNTSPARKYFFFREDIMQQNRLEQTGESSSKSRFNSLSGEISYDLNSLDNITGSFGLNGGKGSNNYEQHVEQLNTLGEVTEAYKNLNSGDYKTNGNDLSLSYQHSSRKNDQQLLSFSFNRISSDNKSTSDFALQPIFNYTGRVSTTNNQDKSRQYTLQADYIQPVGKQILELGLKSLLDKNSSNYFYKTQDPETGEFLLDSSQSNNFNYNQDIHAAYVSLTIKMGNWGLRSGARAEQTRLDADFRSSGTEVKQNYLNLFPSATLSYLLKGTSTIKLSYNQRIERPGLYYLDPYVDLTDPLNISFGNPTLDPATSHTVQLEFDTFFKGTSINTNIYHNFTNNSIQQFTVLGTDSVARTTYGNLGQNRNYGLTLNGNTTLFKKLNISINSGSNYVSYTSQLEGKPQNNEGFTYHIQGSTSYRFGKGWRASGNLGYNSPNILLQGKTGGYTWSSLSVNKDFLKDNKASINLAVRSPFRKTRSSSTKVINPNFYQVRESNTEIRQFSLSFNYRFGKLK
ncbi:TonB-dependent receptor [Pontibacter sp. KCTC 32443]|uniref:TonB-dependent receptor domain-containing protein n=1 Tax=Pontibacter TaxID=323449 RepID=UPI00164D08F5|nr:MULTISPECIES: TonB-dependent receptor [Pontibacter]MBC5775619.1 TonB-dependent receptor [Pontibacter sp. KCTC 32443]